MPLFIPILIFTGVASAMGWGVKKGADGVGDIKESKRIAEAAKRRYDRNMRVLEEARQDVNTAANDYGVFKLEVARDTLGDMVRLLEELQRRGKVSAFQNLAGVEFAPDAFIAELKEASGTATAVLGGVVLGAVKGTLTGAGLYGLAGSIGVASTGAVIGGLSGAAAESATLAWLGGGALAAGGWGMAGGMVVLGGVVAAPVFLITGYAIASAGAKAMVGAQKFDGEVDVAVAGMDAMNGALKQVKNRISELRTVIGSLQQRAQEKLAELWPMIDSYDEHHSAHSGRLAAAMNLCKAISDLLKAPVIVGDKGALNPDIPGLLAQYADYNP